MIYQKLLIGTKPYFINLEEHVGFEPHRPPEIEINYCIKGPYNIIIDGHTYTMHEGSIAIIGSLLPHSYPQAQNVVSLTIEVGPVFLEEYFDSFFNCTVAPVYHIDGKDNDIFYIQELRKLCIELATTYKSLGDSSRLLLLSNLYKICDCLYRFISENDCDSSKQRADYMIFANIEKALNFIHAHYTENISVDDAAALTGYGKSNFCKHFKNITGDTFHHYLNRYRIETAQYFLRETSYSLSEIASMTGFSDTKILCRLFKTYTGVTPGNYRKGEIG